MSDEIPIHWKDYAEMRVIELEHKIEKLEKALSQLPKRPSDEEIDAACEEASGCIYGQDGFHIGARWMAEKVWGK